MNKLYVISIFLLFGSLLVGFVSAVPPDSNDDGCVSLGEIASYVSQWLQGQISLSQVSSGVSWWLNGCQVVNNLPLHSAAQTLTWPPPVQNDGFIGAESNPTGDPIGGYYGYRRIVYPSDADYIVYNREEFLDLFKLIDEYGNQTIRPGDIVYIDDNSVIDITGEHSIRIPANVTIASGRGRDFSKGGIIRSRFDSLGGHTFVTHGSHVRFTGLRFEGPDWTTQEVRAAQIFYVDPPRPDNISGSYYDMPLYEAILSRHPYFEVDNCEFSGWSYAAVVLAWNEYLNPPESSSNAWIHHNFFHHSAHAGLGYGIIVGGYTVDSAPINALIEANLFDRNRHSITSVVTPYSSFEARYNIDLGTTTHTTFDRHRTGGAGGDYTIMHHNTDRYHGLDGKASINPGDSYMPQGYQVYNNRLHAFAEGDPPNVLVFNNIFEEYSFPFQEIDQPVPRITINKDNAKVGEALIFSAAESYDTGQISYVCWDFGDQSEELCDFKDVDKSHAYSSPGRYLVSLKAVNTKGVPITTTKSVIVHPNNPNAVVLSFWIRDSYNNYPLADDASGYFTKRVLVDNQVVWERDVNADGYGWEHVVVDITNYVDDESVIDFQVRSSQDYQRQNYPAYHPFDFFEVYLDDIYVFNREYSVENFGDWEAERFGNGYVVTPDGYLTGNGATHFYKDSSEPWWTGWTNFDDMNTGRYSFIIKSGYRENSVAGSTRGIKQIIKAPKETLYMDIINTFGSFKDVSDYQLPITFAGTLDSNNNDVLDFAGYSKKFNGVDNYAGVSLFDFSRDWVLDLNVFIPYQNSQQTLMYATNGANFVHLYYSPTNNVVIKTNAAESACSLSGLTHTGFNKIIVGKSCSGSTCTLSCASNGVVNAFVNPPSSTTLSGASTVSFGGYSGGNTNLFGAIQRAKIVKGPIDSTVFSDLSLDKLQGVWYLRDGTNGVIRDGSRHGADVILPGGVAFGSENNRRFMKFTTTSPMITIPSSSQFKAGEEFSVELIARFDLNSDASSSHYVVEGLPWSLINQRSTSRDGTYVSKVMLALKLLNPPDPGYFGENPQTSRYTAAPFYKLKNYEWYHLVFTKYDDYLRVYVNGELMRKTYVPGLTYDTNSIPDLTINAPAYRFDNFIGGPFLGDVQRLSVFDRTLTDADAVALYESSLLACSDSDNDGYGVFPRSGVVNGCRLDGFDCNDANAGVGIGGC